MKKASYRDWTDFLAAVKDMPECRSSWNHEGRTSPEAIRLAERGWPEGMAHVTRYTMPAVNALASRIVPATRWQWDVTGAVYDVGEYLSGVPECWLSATTEETRPVVSIAIDLALSAGIPNSVITRRGAGVAALALSLQAAGYVVEVSAICGTRPRTGDVWIRVPLVDSAGGPMDTDRLLFGLAHPAMTRTLCYGLAEYLGDTPNSHYLAWPASPCPWEADLFLKGAHLSEADWESDSAVSAWLDRTFEALTKTKAGGQS